MNWVSLLEKEVTLENTPKFENEVTCFYIMHGSRKIQKAIEKIFEHEKNKTKWVKVLLQRSVTTFIPLFFWFQSYGHLCGISLIGLYLSCVSFCLDKHMCVHCVIPPTFFYKRQHTIDTCLRNCFSQFTNILKINTYQLTGISLILLYNYIELHWVCVSTFTQQSAIYGHLVGVQYFSVTNNAAIILRICAFVLLEV